MGSFCLKIILLLSAVSLAGTALFADAAVPGDPARHWKDMNACIRNGDDPGLFRLIERACAGEGCGVFAGMYMRDLVRLAEIEGPERSEKALEASIKSMAGCGGGKNAALLQARLSLHLLFAAHYPDKSEKAAAELYTVRDWRIIGPFGKYGPGDIDYSFGAELIPDFSQYKNYKTAGPDPHSGIIDVDRHVYPHNGVAYAVTSFRRNGPVKIRIYTLSPYRAFVNGREAVRNTGDRFRSLRILRIGGEKGITLMLKLYGGGRRFRVVATDDGDRILSPDQAGEEIFRDEVPVAESEEYPADELKKQGAAAPSWCCEALGDYYAGIRSTEAVEWYRKSLEKNDDPAVRYKLAEALILLSGENRSSAKYNEGWRIIDALRSADPGFVPALHRGLRRDVALGDVDGALSEGKRIIEAAPGYIMGYVEMLRLFSEHDLRKEHSDLSSRFKTRFPNSVVPLFMDAEFWSGRNRRKFREIHESILAKRYNRGSALALIGACMEAGEYGRALELIDSMPGYGGRAELRLDLYMKKKEYANARKLLFTESITRDDPSLYYRLGLVDYFRGMDPSMYWGKMLRLDPSAYRTADFLDYAADPEKMNPFAEFAMDEGEISQRVRDRTAGDAPATVLSRRFVFRLNADGTCRVFAEELVHLHDAESVGSWGEYRIPFRGDFHPVHARVFGPDGVVRESYRVHSVDGDRYLSLNSVAEDSVIHVAYIVDNPIRDPRHSVFFSPPLMLFQNYDEKVVKADCIVIAPRDMTVRFLVSGDRKVEIVERDDVKQYSVTLRDLPPVSEEYYSGSDFNCLPYFSFTTMDDFSDFTRWYNGLLSGKGEIRNPPETAPLKGGTVEETICRTYEYAARKTGMQNNVLYYPGTPEDTLYIGRGTPEDKTVLAKSILDSFGIVSYIAFVPAKHLPQAKMFPSTAVFSQILLYVPLENDRGTWLDFSGTYYPCGMVNSQADGGTALVLLKNGGIWKNVRGSEPGGVSGDYKITVNGNGSGTVSIRQEFAGEYSAVREFFEDTAQREQNIVRYYMRLIPSLETGNYGVENTGDCSKPLRVFVDGKSPRIALVGRDKVMLQPVINKSGLYRYIRYNERTQPLLVASPIKEDETYEYALPVKGIGKETEKILSVKSRFGEATVEIGPGEAEGRLLVKKRIEIRPALILPREYGEFLRFCMEIKKIENVTLSLDRK